jgi:hypothetical protein
MKIKIIFKKKFKEGKIKGQGTDEMLWRVN